MRAPSGAPFFRTRMHILIDANGVGHAAHRAKVLNYAGFQTQAPFAFAKLLRDLRMTYPEASIALLWDGRAQFRYDLLPSYKGARELKEQADPEEKKSKDAYRAIVPVIRKMAELMGVRQILHPHKEADDLGGLFACHLLKGRRVKLVTGDSDWFQFINELVDCYDHREGGTLTNHANFLERTGFHTPAEFLEGKALQGDDSDSIPGIPQLGPKTAVELIARFESVEKFFAAVDSGAYTPKVRKSKKATSKHPEEVLASPEGRAMFRLNMQLMDLRNPAIDPRDLQFTEGRLNLDQLKTLFGRLGFVSLLQNFEAWTMPLVSARASQQSPQKEAISA